MLRPGYESDSSDIYYVLFLLVFFTLETVSGHTCHRLSLYRLGRRLRYLVRRWTRYDCCKSLKSFHITDYGFYLWRMVSSCSLEIRTEMKVVHRRFFYFLGYC